MNHRLFSFLLRVAVTLAMSAQVAETVLPEVTVYSPRVANQSPAATFAMPVSALRFEPRVDLQSRNFAEGQADVTIRGGIFENTGFSVGAVSLFDPQTGHYFAEIPVAPAMLGSPDVLTGADVALHSINATVGCGRVRMAANSHCRLRVTRGGEFGLVQGEFYQGYARRREGLGRRLGVDVAFAHSESDGSIPFGDHEFDRFNGRLQLADLSRKPTFSRAIRISSSAGRICIRRSTRTKRRTSRRCCSRSTIARNSARGDFFEVGAFYRQNEDDYAFNRFAPVGPIHPFQHTTWVRGAAAAGGSRSATSRSTRGPKFC